MQDTLGPVLAELADIEAKLLKALPGMSAGAASDYLRDLVSTHLSETEEHGNRLKKVAKMLGWEIKPAPSAALAPVLEAGKKVLDEEERSLERDLSIIGTARQAEHLEIDRYTSAISLAKTSGAQVVELLEKSLREEQHADRLLAELSAEIKCGAIHPASSPAD